MQSISRYLPSFNTPWKHQKICFLMFSGGKERLDVYLINICYITDLLAFWYKYLFLLEILSIILILICYHLLTKGIHCVKYAKIRVPLARTFPYKDRITLSAKYGLEKNRYYYAINNKKDTRISPLTLKRSTATKWWYTL